MADPRGNVTDEIRFSRAFAAVRSDVDAIKTQLGINTDADPAPVSYLIGSCATLAAAPAAVAAETDTSYPLGGSVEVPASLLPVGSLLRVRCCIKAVVTAWPWSFALTLEDSPRTHPLADADTLADPGVTTVLLSAELVATVRDAGGGNLQLDPDGTCWWHAPGGTTNRWSGVTKNSDYSGLPTFTAGDTLVLEPSVAVTGAAVGNTLQLLSLSATVIQPSSLLA